MPYPLTAKAEYKYGGLYYYFDGSTAIDIPSITGIDTTANKVTIDKEFLKKYTLIKSWASWCWPCRTVNQELRQRRIEFKKAGVELRGFSLDMVSEPWKQAVAKDNTGWLQLSDLKVTESPIVNSWK